MRKHSCFLPKLDRVALFFLILLILGGLSATAMEPIYVTQKPAEVGNVLRKGRLLELQKRWSEALTHYEKAIRDFPDEVNLHHRYENARLHHDVAKRYNDRSFCKAAREYNLERALDTYIEVSLKIHSHYVKTPHWKEMIECGMNGLDVALQSPGFLRENGIANIPQSEITQIRHDLRRELGRQIIKTHTDARAAVAHAAETLSKKLGVRPAAVVLEFCCASVNTLDPYSAFLTPDQLSEVYSQIDGNFVGLGIELKTIKQQLVIVRVIPSSPAEEAGIKQGDTILAINNQTVASMPTDKAANLLQGPSGSEVRLTMLRPNRETYQTTATRRRVDVPSVEAVKIV
ncbi:MAG: PDZ domain-containing protein, partial [Planctomycetia bacterium]